MLLLYMLFTLTEAAQWAVLVAGSNGFQNYRHQADLCHAYHVLLAHGVPASNIIVMSYNDIANSSSNPFPDELFNAAGKNATNVYSGCVVDYPGVTNNSTNFLAVLTGNEDAVKGVGTGRVLKTFIWDTVFVNFVDHGASGVLSFPNEGDYLYADTLVSTLKEMKDKWRFSKLVFFLEACDGGSMFDGLLPDDIDVYAVTASGDSQFSWAVYCPPDDLVRGIPIGSCLGDLFSVNWMDVFSKSDPETLTLAELFKQVSILTNASTPMQFGDMDIASLLAGHFLGYHSSSYSLLPDNQVPGWTTRDAKLMYLAASDPEQYEVELADQLRVSSIFESLTATLSPEDPAALLTAAYPVRNFECLREAMAGYQQACGVLSEFALSYVVILKNACEKGVSSSSMATTLAQICRSSSNV